MNKEVNPLLRPAVFLDRDGTLIAEKSFLFDPEHIELESGVVEGLLELQKRGFLLVGITNQSGIAAGYFSLEQYYFFQDCLAQIFTSKGVFFSGFYFCPHHPVRGTNSYVKECKCRKPKPGMLLQAAHDLQIDLSKSYMVGDRLSDVEAGQRAGAKSILVKTGLGITYQPTSGGVQPDFVATNFEMLLENIC